MTVAMTAAEGRHPPQDMTKSQHFKQKTQKLIKRESAHEVIVGHGGRSTPIRCGWQSRLKNDWL